MVVVGPFLGITQHTIGLGKKVEFASGRFRVVIYVRMPESRKFTIRRLNVGVGGRTFNTQGFVVIDHRALNSYKACDETAGTSPHTRQLATGNYNTDGNRSGQCWGIRMGLVFEEGLNLENK